MPHKKSLKLELSPLPPVASFMYNSMNNSEVIIGASKSPIKLNTNLFKEIDLNIHKTKYLHSNSDYRHLGL